MHFALSLVSEPATEPVTLAEAKTHSRVTGTAQDTLITGLIVAAREWAEGYTRRAFVTQTFDLFLDDFPASSLTPILFPKAPLQTIGSVKYIDVDGVEQTWPPASYRMDNKSEPGRLTPEHTESWPSPRDVTNAVTIRFTAGFGDASAVPQRFKHAILLLVAHWYERREQSISGTIIAEIPLGVQALLSSRRPTV